MKELELEELLVIDGGACSWSGAKKTVISGRIGGFLVGGIAGSNIGGIGAGIAYGATCWW